MSRKKNTENKLQKDLQDEVIQLLAAWKTPTQIVKYLEESRSVSVTVGAICYYERTYPEKIEAYRERIRQDLLTIPIANLSYRLKKRQELVDMILDNAETDGRMTREDVKTLNNLLDSAAKDLGEEFGRDEGKGVVDVLRKMTGQDALEFVLFGKVSGK